MKQPAIIISALLLLLAAFTVKAQNGPPPPPVYFVITEIMYNPPEAGADSLEFIEIRSNTGWITSLNNVQLVSGVAYVFPDGAQTNSNGYAIVAKDSVAFENTFGIPAYQWTSGSLLNTGETITLINPYKFGDDSVAYSGSFPWPTEANGLGHSLTLCETFEDNYGPEYWQASNNNTGIEVNGFTIYADPGELPNCLVGIGSTAHRSDMQAYPNPTNGGFTLRFPELHDDAIFSIHNSNGSLIYVETIRKDAVKLEKEMNLAPGLYLLKLVTDDDHYAQYLIVTE